MKRPRVASLAALLTFTFALHTQAVALRYGRPRLVIPQGFNNSDDGGNATHLLRNRTSESVQTEVPAFASYAACFINPSSCVVNGQKVATDLASRVVLFFGCSLDIYAVDYFCKAANAPVTGFTRAPGISEFAPGNLAYCNIGGLILAYSFNPGSSGPPYFEACDKVLKTPCSQVRSAALIQQSVVQIVQTFGHAPSAIVVDSSLWDAASWWMQDGKPPEPYIAPAPRVGHWCQNQIPALLHAVQMASPTSKVAFRTAPRVEFIAGYGHSMPNIEAMNACFRASALGSLMGFTLIDYNSIVEMFLARQGGLPSSFFEDAFHPGVLPSVLYVDWVLQWVKTLPVGR